MRLSIDLRDVTYAERTVTQFVIVYKCDRCERRTDEQSIRLRPIAPIPRSGVITHECSMCVQKLDRIEKDKLATRNRSLF